MCHERCGKFIVPIKPSVLMGWWIGEIIGVRNPIFKMNGVEITLYEIVVVRVENTNYRGNNFILSSGPFREFDSEAEALNCLTEEGKIIPSPV